MADRLGGIGGALERFEEAELDLVLLGGAFGGIEQGLDVGAVVEVAGLVAVLLRRLGVVGEPRWIGILVDAENGRLGAFAEELRNRLVGDEHALFDKLVGMSVNDLMRLAGAAVFIELDFDLRHLQIQRAVGEAILAQQGGHFPCLLDRADERRIRAFRCALAIEDGLRLFVGKLRTRVDHRIDEFRVQDMAVF